MKKLFLGRRMASTSYENSVFAELDPRSVDLNTGELEELFAAKTASSSAASAAAAGSNAKKRANLLTKQRSNNVGILLTRFRAPAERIRDAIMSMDTEFLTAERVNGLLSIIPTEDEEMAIAAYVNGDGDLSLLDISEKFFMEVGNVPRLRERLEMLKTYHSFPEQISSLREMTAWVSAAVQNVEAAEKLARVFELVLAIGSFLNGEWLDAFSLNFLGKLKNTKATNGQTHLLHYLATYIQREAPELSDFMSDLKYVEEASKHGIDDLVAEANKVKKGLAMVEREMDEASSLDAMSSKLRPFYADACAEFDVVTAAIDALQRDYAALVARFGEDKKTPSKEFFAHFHNFGLDYQLAVKQNERRRKQQERAERAAQHKRERRRSAAAIQRRKGNSRILSGRLDSFKRDGKGNATAGSGGAGDSAKGPVSRSSLAP